MIHGKIIQLNCTYIPESKSGNDTSNIKVKGTLHWVSVAHAITAEVRLYDRLFKVEDPSSEEGDFKDYINPDSLQVVEKVYAEPALKNASINERYQFLRKGYFTLDKNSSSRKINFQQNSYIKRYVGKGSEERIIIIIKYTLRTALINGFY